MIAGIPLALVLGAPALAQVTTGIIPGYLFDPAHKPIAGARLASDVRRSVVRQRAAHITRFNQVAAIPRASYTLAGRAPNFVRATPQVQVAAKANARVDFELAIATWQESVTLNEPYHLDMNS